jgi:hypothetical protein
MSATKEVSTQSVPFGFDVQESWTLVKRILEAQDEVPTLHSFGRVIAQWEKAKAPLRAALDQKTARTALNVEYVLTAQQRGDALKQSISYGAYERATDEVNKAEERIATAHNDEQRETARTALAKRRAFQSLLCRAAPKLEYFAWLISSAHLGAEMFPSKAEAPRLHERFPMLRNGQSLSRAVAAYLRHDTTAHNANHPVFTADEAAQIVDGVWSAANVKGRTGQLVLSVNPLDMLLSSENSAWHSCHCLDDCHRAGNLSYLADQHSAIAYYSDENREYHGADLPYKAFRAMVYADMVKGAASIQRTYGTALPEDVRQSLRREIALWLARGVGGLGTTNPTEEPKWYRSSDNRRTYVNASSSLAYLDSTTEYVTLRERERPSITLCAGLCGACGGKLDSASSLVCTGCNGEARCHSCDRRVDEGDAYPDDDGHLCERCYLRHYATCADCGRTLSRDAGEVYSAENSDNEYCGSCFREHYSYCEHCHSDQCADDFRSPRQGEHRYDSYCESCAEECIRDCYSCDESFHRDELAAHSDGESYCAECLEERERLDALYLRLTTALVPHSPAKRVALRLYWQSWLPDWYLLVDFSHLDAALSRSAPEVEVNHV